MCDNEVDFSSEKIRPHITLLMGEVEEKDLSKIKNIVNNLQFDSLNQEIIFDLPFIKNNYVFVEVKDVKPFKVDCDRILDALKDLIVPHRYLISSGNIPHITLGYVEQAGGEENKLLTEYLKTIKKVPNCKLSKVSVNLAGQHGTVICDFEN